MTSSVTAPYLLRIANWPEDRTAISEIRHVVFIKEQRVPEELEWDGQDDEALHLIAEDTRGNAIATARMLPDGHIGRVAVAVSWRNRGVGRALMQQLLKIARQRGYRRVFLDAQVEAIDFYRQLGFIAEGDIFMDAGIPHRHMFLALPPGEL